MNNFYNKYDTLQPSLQHNTNGIKNVGKMSKILNI